MCYRHAIREIQDAIQDGRFSDAEPPPYTEEDVERELEEFKKFERDREEGETGADGNYIRLLTPHSGVDGRLFVDEGLSVIREERVSRDMATQGNKISLNKTNKGDLVFFRTNKSKKSINHVGLVVENKKGEIFFIHSTTSLGVITSSLDENYWKSSFVEARRIL